MSPRKEIKMYTHVSPAQYEKLKQFGKDKGIATIARCIMFLIYNYHPTEVIEDYSFNRQDCKVIGLTLSESEKQKINELMGKYGITKGSTFIRSWVYTFFLQSGQ